MTYEFDFSKVTIGDMRPLWSGNITLCDLMEFANKVTVGGIMHLPITEQENLLSQFNDACLEWAKSRTDKGAEPSLWNEMLRDVKGL